MAQHDLTTKSTLSYVFFRERRKFEYSKSKQLISTQGNRNDLAIRIWSSLFSTIPYSTDFLLLWEKTLNIGSGSFEGKASETVPHLEFYVRKQTMVLQQTAMFQYYQREIRKTVTYFGTYRLSRLPNKKCDCACFGNRRKYPSSCYASHLKWLYIKISYRGFKSSRAPPIYVHNTNTIQHYLNGNQILNTIFYQLFAF
ncbi:hypothetical protein AGLY_002078 [Aphis glycines]|uniref:Uncharacterized protein n=1 Tax=Aphis glycines TaxID=307491 RepID=A0A6G0U5X2_APHGL|nr:hypothetical protein AGLY_002078 [Aphis glycines]